MSRWYQDYIDLQQTEAVYMIAENVHLLIHHCP